MAKKNSSFTDYSKNNKVALRNFTEPNDIHDVIKTLLVRLLRRKYPNNKSTPIYTETNPDDLNENYPDIWMKLPNKSIIIYEIQRKVSKQWIDTMKERYNTISDWQLIDINKIEKEWENELKKSPRRPIEKLNKILEKEII
jgi:hypothetical protein